MTGVLEMLAQDDDAASTIESRESDARTKFVVLCGARWINHRDHAAARELIETLQSGDADLVLLAGALLTEGCACA